MNIVASMKSAAAHSGFIGELRVFVPNACWHIQTRIQAPFGDRFCKDPCSRVFRPFESLYSSFQFNEHCGAVFPNYSGCKKWFCLFDSSSTVSEIWTHLRA